MVGRITTNKKSGNRLMTVTKSHHFNARVVAAVLVLAFGVTESRANSIRYDDPNNGGVGNWSTPSDSLPDYSGFKPAGVTGGPSGIYEDTTSSDLYNFLPSNPLFSNYTTGFMFDWGTGSSVAAQVMVYTGTADGTQTVCDDQGGTCQTPTGTVTEIDFNYSGGIYPAGGCAAGGSLTWDNATYVDHSKGTSCDNAFMFVNGALFGSIPAGWTTGTAPPPTSVPEPTTLALFGAGLGSLLFTRRRRFC
jgi:PEP-CTERM motif